MISRNAYNHCYSRKADRQRVPLTSDKTAFYEEEYQSVENHKTADAFGELLHLSLLADEKHCNGNLS